MRGAAAEARDAFLFLPGPLPPPPVIPWNNSASAVSLWFMLPEVLFTPLNSYTAPNSDGSLPANAPNDVIPDGNGGVLASWESSPCNYGACPLSITDIGPNGAAQAAFSSLDMSSNLTADNILVLGDNNTAFATDGITVVSFNVSTLQQNWAYTSTGGSLSLVAATSGGGVAVEDSQQGLIQIDSNGNASPPAAGFSNSGPWALGFWPMISNNELAFVFGPDVVTAESDSPEQAANGAANRQSREPVIAHFFTSTAADLGASPSAAFSDTTDYVSASPAHHIPFVWDPTPEEFTNELSKPIDIVGFIGHSFDIDNPPNAPFSVGLRFSTNTSALVRPSQPGDNPGYIITEPGTRIVPTTKINSQASVVFVGSCFAGPAFLSLWNINDQSKGRALVVPRDPTAEVYLGHALAAWQRLLYDMLVKGMSVEDAVIEINKYLPRLKDISGRPISEQYTWIGDKCLTLRGEKKGCGDN